MLEIAPELRIDRNRIAGIEPLRATERPAFPSLALSILADQFAGAVRVNGMKRNVREHLSPGNQKLRGGKAYFGLGSTARHTGRSTRVLREPAVNPVGMLDPGIRTSGLMSGNGNRRQDRRRYRIARCPMMSSGANVNFV